jgi:hypothetical protein
MPANTEQIPTLPEELLRWLSARRDSAAMEHPTTFVSSIGEAPPPPRRPEVRP